MSSPSVGAFERTTNYSTAVGDAAAPRKGPVFGPVVHLANVAAQTLAILAGTIAAGWLWDKITGERAQFAPPSTLVFLGLLTAVAVAFAVLADRGFQRDFRAPA